MDVMREEQHSNDSGRHGRVFTYVGNSSRYYGHCQNTLRIEKSMRYNALNGQSLPLIALAHSVSSTMRKLTQPTGLGGGLGWYQLYQPFSNALVGFIRAFCVVSPERNQDALISQEELCKPICVYRLSCVPMFFKLSSQ
jgi:hypothetical protein